MSMINTTKGPMEADTLKKRTGQVDNDNELTKWVEYWDGEELIHRSVHVHLKRNVVAEFLAAQF